MNVEDGVRVAAVYEGPGGALAAEPEVIPLPGEAAALALGNDGVQIFGSSSTGNVVQGNLIGFRGVSREAPRLVCGEGAWWQLVFSSLRQGHPAADSMVISVPLREGAIAVDRPFLCRWFTGALDFSLMFRVSAE